MTICLSASKDCISECSDHQCILSRRRPSSKYQSKATRTKVDSCPLNDSARLNIVLPHKNRINRICMKIKQTILILPIGKSEKNEFRVPERFHLVMPPDRCPFMCIYFSFYFTKTVSKPVILLQLHLDYYLHRSVTRKAVIYAQNAYKSPTKSE